MLRYTLVSAVLLAVMAWASVADAGIFFRRGCRGGCCGGNCNMAPVAPPAATPAPPPPSNEAQTGEAAQVANNEPLPATEAAETQDQNTNMVQPMRRMRRVGFARLGWGRLFGRRYR